MSGRCDWLRTVIGRGVTSVSVAHGFAAVTRCTLRYLGVPVEGPSYMLGDNKTVVDTSSHPHGKLQERHNALSFHKTRHAIAAGVTRFYHIRGNTNPGDILSKHWEYRAVWPMMRVILFWQGDTAKVEEE